MKETLAITNFGPIDRLEITDIKPAMVLIGDSGSGKSTLLKVLALCRWLAKMLNIRSYLKHSGVSRSPFHLKVENLLRSNELEKYRRAGTEIRYTFGSVTLELTSSVKGLRSIVPMEELSLEKISFISDKRNVMPSLYAGDLSLRHSFYLDQTYNDYLLASGKISSLDIPYLGVKYVARKVAGQGMRHFIEPSAGEHPYQISLKNASSGTQNVVPLHLILEYYAHEYDLVEALNRSILSYLAKVDSFTGFRAATDLGKIPHKRVTLLMEEPELSLYPGSQLRLLDYIMSMTVCNPCPSYRLEVAMATHSPYIVNYLNVLLTNRGAASAGSPALTPEKLQVFRLEDGHMQDMMLRDGAGNPVAVDTSSLLEPMDEVARRYAANVNSRDAGID